MILVKCTALIYSKIGCTRRSKYRFFVEITEYFGKHFAGIALKTTGFVCSVMGDFKGQYFDGLLIGCNFAPENMLQKLKWTWINYNLGKNICGQCSISAKKPTPQANENHCLRPFVEKQVLRTWLRLKILWLNGLESNLVPSFLRELQFFACADRLDQNRALSVC